MKLTAKNDQPNNAFVEKLIDDAVERLVTTRQNTNQKERESTMKFSIKFTAAIAALLIVVGTITVIKTVPQKQDVMNPRPIAADIVHAEVPGNNEMVSLPLVLPTYVGNGTERVPDVENMQELPEYQRPVFYVPAGTTNVALGKPVTGTDENPIGGTLAKITDGDKSGADGSFIEMGLFDQYVTIDLGERHNIYAIMAWHYYDQKRVYFDVVVQVADDPDFTTNVVTIFNNDTDNSLGLGIGMDKHYIETLYGKLIDAKGVQGRYVRLYSNGNDVNELNHYIEVEVYGKSIKK